MKRLRRLGHAVEQFLTSPLGELGRFARFVRFQVELWRFCARRLRHNNLLAMSSALSFRTIFAMIPALVLALLVAKSVGLLGDSRTDLRKVLAAAGFSEISLVKGEAPAATRAAGTGADAAETQSGPQTVTDWIVDLVADVEQKLTLGRIGPIGVLLLIWTSLTLLTTVERSLNRVFEAPVNRPMTRSVLLYWSAMTLAPVVVAAAVYVADSASAAMATVPVLNVIVSTLGWVGHLAVAILVVAMIYQTMPNARVVFRWAVGGAAVAVPLWVLAERAFSIYVSNFVGSGSLYGTLALLPLFLMWLNACWQIFLFGAQITYTGANLARMRASELAERALLGPTEMLAVALAVGRSYTAGRGPLAVDRLCDETGLPEALLRKVVDRLAADGLVAEVAGDEGDAFVLARPPETIRFLDVAQLAEAAEARSLVARCAPELQQRLKQALARPRDMLASYTLADILVERERG